jgi:hypothetical protein
VDHAEFDLTIGSSGSGHGFGMSPFSYRRRSRSVAIDFAAYITILTTRGGIALVNAT